MSQSFTLQANGILRTLITECGISEPYDPNSELKQPKVIRCKGLWDTGATGTVITKDLANKLGLKPVGKAKTFHANGMSVVDEYLVNIYLPNNMAISTIRVTEGILNGFELLIGMDIITLGDFSITNLNGQTTFSFRMPSMHKVDFNQKGKPVQVKKSLFKKAQYSGVGRNESCPCGSGKKFKRCHGQH